MKPELQDDDLRIPRRFEREVRDLVHPIILRRSLLWRAGMLLGALFGITLLAWILFFRPPTGKALVKDAVAAAGGMENWNTIDGGVFTRVHTRYDEAGEVRSEEVETFYFRKNGDFRLRVESRSAFGHVVIGRDDEGYWATKDGQPISPVIVAGNLGMMCHGDECTPDCAATMAFYRFSLPFKLTDPGVIPAYAGQAELNGVPVALLEATFEPGVGSDRWVFYLDAESKLIRKIEHYPSADGDAAPEEIYWSDHKAEHGITFSHRQSYYRSNGTKLEEYVITDADFATPVPDELFVRPEKRTVQPAALDGRPLASDLR